MVSNLASIPQSEIGDQQSAVTDSLPNHHPFNDPDFAAEATDSRAHILKWYDAVTTIDAAPRGQVVSAISMATLSVGKSYVQVRRVFYAWKNDDRNWQQLANRSKWPDPIDSNLPGSFIHWVNQLHSEHQRDTSFKRTYDEVIARYEMWEKAPGNPDLAIPGYDKPPRRNPVRHHPPGWSCSNLQKRCKLDPYEKAVRRQGPKHASTFLPSVRTSRAKGLAPGQVVYFDDQEHDNWVNVTGRNDEAVRPQSFNCVEALSGDCPEVGVKPQLIDPSSGTWRELNQVDFFWFSILYLTKHGYNAESGTTLVFEHGKANPDKRDKSRTPDHFDIMIEKVTNGAVKPDRSGIWRAPEFKAMLFEGKPTGNFRFKAPIESLFNLVRNYSDRLPAPTGRNRDRAPEESHGLVLYNNQLQKLIDVMDPRTFMALQRPVLEWEDYRRAHMAVMDAIGMRRDHELEGYRKLGFTSARYRLQLDDKAWMNEAEYLAIPAHIRAGYDSIVSRPGFNESFLLAPREVFLRVVKPALTRLPMRFVPLLAPERVWEDVTVTNSLEMIIEDQWLDADPLVFIAKVKNQHGYEINLARGKKYKRLLNPFYTDVIWIAEAEGTRKGAFIGTAARVDTASKVDYEAILHQMSEKSHVRSTSGANIHAYMQSEAGRRVAMRSHNKALLDDKKKGRPERLTSDERSRVVGANDFLPIGNDAAPASDNNEALDVANAEGLESPESSPIASASDFL